MGWSRKAQTCGFQMIPIPADPLALPFTHKTPFTHKSDPLRGPIFVPLDTECLMGNKSYLFEGKYYYIFNKHFLLSIYDMGL